MIPLWDDTTLRRPPWATLLLAAANVAAFAYAVVVVSAGGSNEVFRAALVPRDMVAHPGWPTAATLLTSMFLHGDVFHLLGNLWYLWVFGRTVESAMGAARYLLFYVLAGTVAALAHVVADPVSAAPLVGASGAIAGVLGAYFVLARRARVRTLIPVVPFLWMPIFRVPAWIFLLAWFGMQWIGLATSEAGSGGVAWMAHIGGFATGALLAFSFGRRVRT